MNIPQTIGSYLVHSYLYYVLGNPVIPDTEYDKLCKNLLTNFDKHDKHPHISLVTKEELKAGTGFTIKEEEYPLIVKILANKLLEEINEKV